MGGGRDVIKTLIAEQSSIVRAGLAALLSDAADIEVVAELERGDQVLLAAQALLPDVAVLAANLPGLDGFATAEALQLKVPSCYSLIMGEQRDHSGLRRAVAVHAAGFIVSDAPADDIAAAVRRAAAGRKVVDPDLAFAALDVEESPLTPRELDALRLAGKGSTASQVAEELCLSVGTVRNYLSRAVMKTGARNLVDAIRIAGGAGWF